MKIRAMAGARWRSYRAFFAHPSALLLLAQLLEILLYPATRGLTSARAILDVVGVVVLLLALRLIHRVRGVVWLAFALGAVAIGLGIARAVTSVPALAAWQAGAEALVYFYTARCLIGYMLANRRATVDELFAAAATFTLLVWAFTQLLLLCQLLQPDAFGSASEPRTWSELMFMSFSMFTATGIGNAVPARALSRAVGDLEMFTGVMYLALVVSRLVGLAASAPPRKHGARDEE